jgi:adenosylcobinamide-phosphate synthase
MDLYGAQIVIPAAFALDLLLGDPPRWPHPIRWMGRAAGAGESIFRRQFKDELTGGFLFALLLVTLTWGATAGLTATAMRIHPLAGWVVETVLIYYALSVRSLKDSALAVAAALSNDGLEAARVKVAGIVGRDADTLDQEGVVRATLETVAENLVDGVMSPLFFAAIGGAPLAMAFKMISTLDSMVGYKNERYIRFGKASARLDDFANYIPARFAVPVIAVASQLLFRRGSPALSTALREGRHHSSPNAGLPEAAFAGALGVKLGGPSYYQGVLIRKPYIGVDFGEIESAHIAEACRLMVLSSLLWMLVAWGIYALL